MGSSTAHLDLPPIVAFFIDNDKDATRLDEPRNPIPPSLRPKVRRIPLPPAPAEAPEGTSSEPPSNAITDWSAEAKNAVDSVLQRERARSARRSFSRGSQPSPKLSKPDAFGSDLNHRAGAIESFDDGAERHWVSDDCYIDFTRDPPSLLLRSGMALNLVRCKSPTTSDSDKLFNSLAPGYLQWNPKPEDNR
jgi:hypothetical protein